MGKFEIEDDTTDIYQDESPKVTIGNVIKTKKHYNCIESYDSIPDILQPDKQWSVSGWFKKINEKGYLISRSGNLISDRSSLYISNNSIVRFLGGSIKTIFYDFNSWNYIVWQNYYDTEWKDQIYINGVLIMTNQIHVLTQSNYELNIGCRKGNFMSLLGSYSNWNLQTETTLNEIDIINNYESYR